MHEDDTRLLSQHMTVDRGNLYAVRSQRFHDWIDLSSQQHKITSDRGLAATGGLETNAGVHAHRPGWHQLHAVFRDRIAARYTNLINAPIVLAFGADNLIDLRDVKIDGRRW